MELNPYRELTEAKPKPIETDPWDKIHTEEFITHDLIVRVKFAYDHQTSKEGLVFFHHQLSPGNFEGVVNIIYLHSISNSDGLKPSVEDGTSKYKKFLDATGNPRTVKILIDGNYIDVLWDKIYHFQEVKKEEKRIVLSWKFAQRVR